jgi:hypothetical protein
MSNIEFRSPSKEDLKNQPAFVSDLAIAMGVDYTGEIKNQYGDMVPSAGLFWTNSVSKDINGNYLGAVSDGINENIRPCSMDCNKIGVLPCIKNAAENGITTARLSDDVNDTREYLYDEKTQSFKMVPQSLASGNAEHEIWELLNGEFDKNFERLENEYQRGLMSSEIYKEKLAELQKKHDSFSILEEGVPVVKRFGGNKDGEDKLKTLKTVAYNGAIYAQYEIDSYNNPVKDGAKFNIGMDVENKNSVYGMYDKSHWFKYEPVLAERKENGDVQLRTVLMPCPRISKDMQEELNDSINQGTTKFHPLDYRYLNGNFAAYLGLTTDLVQEHEQKMRQAQEQAK